MLYVVGIKNDDIANPEEFVKSIHYFWKFFYEYFKNYARVDFKKCTICIAELRLLSFYNVVNLAFLSLTSDVIIICPAMCFYSPIISIFSPMTINIISLLFEDTTEFSTPYIDYHQEECAEQPNLRISVRNIKEQLDVSGVRCITAAKQYI